MGIRGRVRERWEMKVVARGRRESGVRPMLLD